MNLVIDTPRDTRGVWQIALAGRNKVEIEEHRRLSTFEMKKKARWNR